MKRSEASNTFAEGLVMDLNPLSTPNNVLTNCLNGTIITYNGNEYVLLNDMGNGRVETAYLPEGYVPIGTAELGGIIYIVSYNPLINKTLIGSFPSPERNISTEEVSDLNPIISNSSFINENNNEIKNVIVKLKLYDDDFILNPGDKYKIYSTNNGIKNNVKFLCISDLPSTSKEPKIDNDPKNITIHVVCLGDDGKITYLDDSLKWDYEINVTDDKGNNYKGNYYISDYDITDDETISNKVDSYRSLVSSAYNIFKSKVSGELALLFELKVIDSFSVSWDADIIKSNYIDTDNIEKNDVQIKFYLNWTSNHKSINPKYSIISSSQISEGITTDVLENSAYTITLENIEDRKNDGTDKSISTIVGKFTYPSSNNDELKNYIWDYTLIPAMKFGKIPYLASSGLINFAEIGSGINSSATKITEWRYYIQESSFYFNWGLSVYPAMKEKIDKIVLTFIPFDSIILNYNKGVIKTSNTDYYSGREIFDYQLSQYTISGKESYSGNFQEIIRLKNSAVSDSRITGLPILKNYLYLVNLCIHYSKKDESNKPYYLHTYGWLYTTGQFNDEFIKGNILDFNTLKLDNYVGFDITNNCNDNIIATLDTYTPNLMVDSELNSCLDSLGFNITTVNYGQDDFNDITTSINNVTFNVDIVPKYNKLFGLTNYHIDFIKTANEQIEETLNNSKSISLSDDSVIYEKSSKYTNDSIELVKPYFDKNIDIKTLGKKINNLINGNSSYDENCKDSFYISALNISNLKLLLAIKGAIISKINADRLVLKSINVGLEIRPIIYTDSDLVSNGFNSKSGLLKYFFTERHRDIGAGDPFGFGFYQHISGSSSKETENTLASINKYISTKDDWNPSDEFSRSNYWDDTPPYTNYLNQWMLGTSGCMQILYHSEGNADGFSPKGVYIKSETSTDANMQKRFEIWVKSSENHYIPINCHSDGIFKNESISSSNTNSDGDNIYTPTKLSNFILTFLSLIYTVNTSAANIDKYIVDNINYVDPYTETWSFNIHYTPKFTSNNNTCDTVLYLKPYYFESKLNCTLNGLCNIINNNFKNINYNNLLHKKTSLSAQNYVFNHTFKLDTSNLYDIYTEAKKNSINSYWRFNINNSEEKAGKVKTSGKIYIYNSDTKDFEILNSNSKLYKTSSLKINDDDKVIITFSDKNNDGVTFPIYDALMLKNNELCFDEAKLLSLQWSYTYKAGDGSGHYGLYNGNSSLKLVSGNNSYGGSGYNTRV